MVNTSLTPGIQKMRNALLDNGFTAEQSTDHPNMTIYTKYTTKQVDPTDPNSDISTMMVRVYINWKSDICSAEYTFEHGMKVHRINRFYTPGLGAISAIRSTVGHRGYTL